MCDSQPIHIKKSRTIFPPFLFVICWQHILFPRYFSKLFHASLGVVTIFSYRENGNFDFSSDTKSAMSWKVFHTWTKIRWTHNDLIDGYIPSNLNSYKLTFKLQYIVCRNFPLINHKMNARVLCLKLVLILFFWEQILFALNNLGGN